ncbi:hypothetical protein K0M31_018344 [Melipona bicolor]|uniref:Uncharacterized protein n=1 Tax=Melipona bicolor TaxID=60889 RepID=A0AA40G3M3_9HYME|nr:hypothetical protein K0M31_018344 [Melipona bicolor]
MPNYYPIGTLIPGQSTLGRLMPNYYPIGTLIPGQSILGRLMPNCVRTLTFTGHGSVSHLVAPFPSQTRYRSSSSSQTINVVVSADPAEKEYRGGNRLRADVGWARRQDQQISTPGPAERSAECLVK